MTDTTDVTQADVARAEEWAREWRHCAGDMTALYEAFARHRLAHAPPVVAGQGLGVAATQPGHSDEPASSLAADAGSVPNAWRESLRKELVALCYHSLVPVDPDKVERAACVALSALAKLGGALELARFVATDPCFLCLGSVTREETIAFLAQGIEAATAGETVGLDGNRESPVGKADAPNLSAVVADEGLPGRLNALACDCDAGENNDWEAHEWADTARLLRHAAATLTRPAIEAEVRADERERCAKIADRVAENAQEAAMPATLSGDRNCRLAERDVAQVIAAAIRSPSSTEADGGVAK